MISTGLQFGVTLDADGNMTGLKEKSATTKFAYNNLNELTRATTVSPVKYAYDADGNLLSYRKRSYLYDAENRLAGILYGANASTTFAYDGLGRRVAITKSSGTTSSTTNYQWCGSRICRAFGATSRRYYDEGEALPPSGQLIYYGPDQLGSPRNFALFDVADKTAAVEALDFDPFGNELAGPAVLQPAFLFAGMFYHANSGLYLTQYRAYDPIIARWLSRDPLGEQLTLQFGVYADAEASSSSNYPQEPLPVPSVNLYTYVADNPITFVDPSGLDYASCFKSCVLWPGVVGTGLGALKNIGFAAKVTGPIGGFVTLSAIALCLNMCIPPSPATLPPPGCPLS